MNILLIGDRESCDYNGRNLPESIATVLKADNNIETVILDGDKLNPCLGCFKCWISTPGLCFQTQDIGNQLNGKEVQADVVIFVTKINYGGYSYDVKSYLDRCIPNISPFFNIVDGEMHHELRYESTKLRIAIGYGAINQAEQATFSALEKRHALNFQPRRSLCYTLSDEDDFNALGIELQKEISGEIGR